MAPHRKAKQVRSNKQELSEIANGLKALAETSQKNNKIVLKKKENVKKDIFYFEERKRRRIGNMSCLFFKYLLLHHSHNPHIVLNLVVKEAVAPLQLLTRINPYKMV